MILNNVFSQIKLLLIWSSTVPVKNIYKYPKKLEMDRDIIWLAASPHSKICKVHFEANFLQQLFSGLELDIWILSLCNCLSKFFILKVVWILECHISLTPGKIIRLYWEVVVKIPVSSRAHPIVPFILLLHIPLIKATLDWE